MTSSTTTIDWQGIALSVSYEPSYFGLGGTSDYAVAHLQVWAVKPKRAALPITETGYRSHFLHPSFVEEAGGPVAYIVAWLDAEAQTPEWQERTQERRQLSLF
ncbi:MAG: hypothetical protein ACK4FG_04625 [Brevundimonas sp.]